MFIYKYMAGIINLDPLSIVEGERFDPHDHRKVESPTTYAQTMSHLLKGCIGAGVLAMPDAIKRMGIIASAFGITMVGVFATFCIQMLIAGQYELCKRARRGYMSYPRSMHSALKDGPPCMRCGAGLAYYFVLLVLVLWQLGICNIYVVFVAENIQQICDYYGFKAPIRMHIIFTLLPLILISLIKDLRLMTPFSSLSNIVMTLGLLLVFFYLIEDDLSFDQDKMKFKDIMGVPLFIGTALFALEAVGVVLALEYNMEDPKQFVGWCGLFSIGMLVIISLYFVVGVFGYLKYGDKIEASITLNLPSDQKKAQAAKLFIAIAIFLSFPLQNFVAYSMIWYKLRRKFTNKKAIFVVDYLLRLLLVILPWCLAIAVPKLGPFIAFFGAFCLSLLAMVFPGILDLCIWYPDKYGTLYYRLLRDIFIIIVGLFCLISGCFTTLREIYTSFQDVEIEHAQNSTDRL